MRRTVLGAACVIALAAGGLTLGGCSDPIALTVTVPDDPVAPDGKTGAKIEVRVARGDQMVNAGTVAFSSSLDGSQFEQPIEDLSQMPGAEAQKTEVSVSAGSASVKLYSIAKGTAKVVITFTDENGSVATATKNVVFSTGSSGTRVAAIRFISAEPAVLQLRDSGGQTTSQVTFQVLDSANAPVRDVQIDFELGSELGGASLDPVSKSTGDNGMVTTTLSSGTTYGTVKVKAYTVDREISGESDPITIAGAAANYKHFDFGCEYRALGGLAFRLLELNCTAAVADRNSQKIPNVQVTFETEAGSVDRFATTDEVGNATTVLKSQEPYPVDVAPNLAYMPSWLIADGENQEPSVACGECTGVNCVCNPRDGLVTLIAVTSGEEEWTDANENGVWDEGEAFVDLPEPYVDANDNGRYDINDAREKDLYIDANRNGVWDDKNFQWDGSTQIWRATKVVWTGQPSLKQNDKDSTTYDPYDDRQITSVTVSHCSQAAFRTLFVDHNLNRLVSRAGDAITCASLGGACTIFPTDIQLGDGGGGRHFNSLIAKDPHACTDEPVPANDLVTCTGVFTQAKETESVITVNMSMTARVDMGN